MAPVNWSSSIPSHVQFGKIQHKKNADSHRADKPVRYCALVLGQPALIPEVASLPSQPLCVTHEGVEMMVCKPHGSGVVPFAICKTGRYHTYEVNVLLHQTRPGPTIFGRAGRRDAVSMQESSASCSTGRTHTTLSSTAHQGC